MSSVTESVPVRTGHCRLTLTIDDVQYNIRRGPSYRRSKVWRLRALTGPRVGACYSVCVSGRQVSCACPDAVRNSAVCKHVRALQALQLVNPRAVPSPVVVAGILAEAGISARGQEGGAA
jgi:hypothetical protein